MRNRLFEPLTGEAKTAWTYCVAASSLRRWIVLAVIVLIGIALRVEWMVAEAPVMGSDGAEYARMAENLFYNHSLVGNFEGPQTLYAPLYPALIAGAMFAVPNAETAGHIVSLLFGTTLIVTIFLIARRIYGQTTAYICSGLVAVHPVLVSLSGSVYNEAAYVTLFMAVIYCGVRALALHRLYDFLLLGACLGLAYLTRVEAFIYVPFFVLTLVIAGVVEKKIRIALIGSSLVVVVFLALATPYIAFLYHHTGSIRLEAKWNVNYTMARNRLSGMNGEEADYGVHKDLTLKGPILAPSAFANFTPYPDTLEDKVRTLIAMGYRNAKFLLKDCLLSSASGSPPLILLITLGLFRQSWSSRRLAHEAVLLIMAGSIAFFVVTASNGGEYRYFFPILPLLLLWAGKGLEELGQFFLGWDVLKNVRFPFPDIFATAFQLCAVVSMLMLSAHGTKTLNEFVIESSREALAEQKAALWLAHYYPGPKRIAVRHCMFPYYANGTLIGLPYADPETTLRYVAQNNVDFVVLENSYVESLPSIGEWLANGIPDDHAQLIFDNKDTRGERVVIYRWQRDSAPTADGSLKSHALRGRNAG